MACRNEPAKELFVFVTRICPAWTFPTARSAPHETATNIRRTGNNLPIELTPPFCRNAIHVAFRAGRGPGALSETPTDLARHYPEEYSNHCKDAFRLRACRDCRNVPATRLIHFAAAIVAHRRDREMRHNLGKLDRALSARSRA